LPWAAHVVGVQPPPVWHVPFVHVWPTGHVHLICPPQPSEAVPHLLPTPPEPHVIGTHAGRHVPLLVPLHVSPFVHEQFNVPPQPFGIVVFPGPSYWAAKTAAIGWIGLRGRTSRSIVVAQVHPHVMGARAGLYAIGLFEQSPWGRHVIWCEGCARSRAPRALRSVRSCEWCGGSIPARTLHRRLRGLP
jgi:hypothetical protein